MVNLATEFSRRGAHVSLVLSSAEGPLLSLVPPCVSVIDLRSPRVLRSLPGLVRYLRRERPDALLSAMTHANLIALWARRIARGRTRLVVSERNTLSRTSRSSPVIRQRLMPQLAKRFYPWADKVVAVSQGVADDLASVASLPRRRITVIYNPLVSQSISHRAQQPTGHPWFESGGSPVILAAGRLTPQKDFATLIQAFVKVRSRHSANLVILGEGAERQELARLVRRLRLGDHVSMPGFVENPLSYMARAAVVVLSSQWEGFPAVLVEAMACGTAVVSTDCPSGPAEILENGKHGSLVPVGDISALADAIARTLDAEADGNGLRRRASAFQVREGADAYLRLLLGTNKVVQR